MIKPEEFYDFSDHPSESATRNMWRAIERAALKRPRALFSVEDRRSFVYGIAATVLLYLAGVGSVSVVRRLIDDSQPPVVKVDRAYQSAIHEFERIVPSIVASLPQSPQRSGALTSRTEQLRLLDAAILKLRQQANGNDLSPLARERLRQLYSMKLQILQQMIEQGEIDL